MPPFIGLTGGIGAGKSTALAALGRLGAVTLSSDRVVHELYGDAEVRDRVVQRFGEGLVRDGEIDRGALASAAFSTDEDRHWLEQLLWPRVGERMAAWRAEQERRSPPPRALVVEVPLLFESGLQRGYDATIAVIADESIRAARAGGRGHRALAEREARQLPQEEKAQLATYTVVNDGSEAELEAQLSSILEMLST
ncbi:MAG TPA: dephospho-CoA kinase [Solirubrobacteraceae bacterium]|jgi:dephospho-CoA kinase|nr:dephospho-CoA kinase [Solirubrobacteraceae bacterium]